MRILKVFSVLSTIGIVALLVWLYGWKITIIWSLAMVLLMLVVWAMGLPMRKRAERLGYLDREEFTDEDAARREGGVYGGSPAAADDGRPGQEAGGDATSPDAARDGSEENED